MTQERSGLNEAPAEDCAAWGARPGPGGTHFSLWAPDAAKVSVVFGAAAASGGVALEARRDGWFSAHVPDVGMGARYAFLVDGRRVPDPASRCQPDGVEGSGQVVDHAAYAWANAGWRGRPWAETVLYELHIGTFSREGTFAGAIAHLDHLVALGITMIELMPVGAFSGRVGWGYDGVLVFAPHAPYGSPDDLKRLVEACHARGLSIILDVVYNHFGPRSNHLLDYASDFFTGKHPTPWGEALDFEGVGAEAVRAFFIENAVQWIRDYHFDGLRLDAVQAIFDEGPDPILAAIARHARAAAPDRPVHLVLENDLNDAHWLERDGSDAIAYVAQWNDDFHHVMRVLAAGRRDGYYADYTDAPLDRLGRALAEGFCYQGETSRHRPDMARGTPSAHLPPTAFVAFLQNHDQVGNSPFGKRLDAFASPAALRLATAVTLLSPNIPMLFMGQEWASGRPFDFFCDFPEPLADKVRCGRRDQCRDLPEFADPRALKDLPDPNAATTRDAAVLDWDAVPAAPHAEWLVFHRALLAVRRMMVVPLLPSIGGNAGSYCVFGDGLEVRWHLDDGRCLMMAINFSDTPVTWRGEGRVLYRLVGKGTGDLLAPWDLALMLSDL